MRHTRNGGTPTTGPLAPTVSGGQLHLPTNDLEIDAAAPRRRSARSTSSVQDLPSLGTDWQVETQFTVQHCRRLAEHRPGRVAGGRQLLPLHADPQPHTSAIYVESSKDAPRGTNGEGTRTAAGGNVTLLPTQHRPVTIQMRYTRVGGANTVHGASTRSSHRPRAATPTGRRSRTPGVLNLNTTADTP